MNHRKACLTAALLTAVMMTAAPAVQAAESPEVSIIDITEDTLPEPAGGYLPTKIWTEEEDGTHLHMTFLVVASLFLCFGGLGVHIG